MWDRFDSVMFYVATLFIWFTSIVEKTFVKKKTWKGQKKHAQTQWNCFSLLAFHVHPFLVYMKSIFFFCFCRIFSFLVQRRIALISLHAHWFSFSLFDFRMFFSIKTKFMFLDSQSLGEMKTLSNNLIVIFRLPIECAFLFTGVLKLLF